MFSDRITAWIRTLVPAIVGGAATWGAKRLGVHLDSTGLTAGAVTAVTGVYYSVAIALERKWPAFGVLLGSAKGTPSYSKTTTETASLPGSSVLASLFPPGTSITIPHAPANTRFMVTLEADGPHVTPIEMAPTPVEPAPVAPAPPS